MKCNTLPDVRANVPLYDRSRSRRVQTRPRQISWTPFPIRYDVIVHKYAMY